MRTKNLKRLLSLLLCLCMVAGLLPATALAVTLPDGTETGSVSATIYLDNGDGMWMEDEKKTTFAADQAGLILHLDFYTLNTVVPSGWTVDSIAFYPEKPGENEWGTVFWYAGGDNGTANNKLYNTDGSYNGVFQILNFTPNGGGMGLEPGTYRIMVYAGYSDGNSYQEACYLSNESFTITDATGSGGTGDPVITTTTLPTAYVGEVYSQTLTATPGTTGNALTWAVAEGSTLPNGLTLTEAGVLSGTPTAAGSSTFTVQVSETVGEETLTATQELTLKVVEASASGWKLKECSAKFWLDPSKTGEPVSSFAVNDYLYLSIDFGAENTWGTAWAGGTHYAGLLSSDKDVTVDNALNFRDLYFDLGDYGSFDTVFKSEIVFKNAGYDSSTPELGTYRLLFFEDSYKTVFYSKEIFTITEESTPVVDPFRFELDNIDADAIGSYVYLWAKDAEGNDVNLWSGTLTEDLQSLKIMGNGYAGKTVSDVRLITYAGGTETVLAEYSGSLTLEDGQSLTLTGKGDNVLVKLPAISHSYGENANIRTWFEESTSGRTYQPGAIVPAETELTLNASARSYGEDDPLKEYDLTTATFSGAGVSGTTYKPAENTGSAAITLSYPKYERKTVTIKLAPTTEGTTLPDLSYAKLSFYQHFSGWTYSANAVVGADNTCTVELYDGVAGRVYMTDAGSYALSNKAIEVTGDTDTITLSVYGAQERNMTVMVTGKLANEDADLAAYANALDTTVSLQAETGGASWGVNSANLSTLLSGSAQLRLWNDWHYTELSNLIKTGGTLKLSCATGPFVSSDTSIQWKQNSLTGSELLPVKRTMK